MKKSRDYIDELTPELIRQYQNGQLTDRERNQVERFLLKSPFEYEAMDGFEHFKGDVTADTELLRGLLESRIKSEVEKEKPEPKSRWWKIAAALALLALFNYVIYITVKSPESLNKEAIALLEEATDRITERTDDTDAATSRTIPHYTPSAPAEQVPARESTDKKPALSDNTSAGEQPDPVTTTPENDLPESTPFDKRVMEETEIAEVVTEAIQKKEEFAAARSFVREAPSADTKTLPKTEVLSDNAKAMAADAGRQTDLQAFDGMIIVSSAPDSTNYISALPLGGYEAFQHYLNQSLKHTNRKAIKVGTVIVSFYVLEDSTLTNFKIRRSLGRWEDRKAIEWIKNGPGWVPPQRLGTTISEEVLVPVKFGNH